jgi:hypothetical protein
VDPEEEEAEAEAEENDEERAERCTGRGGGAREKETRRVDGAGAGRGGRSGALKTSGGTADGGGARRGAYAYVGAGTAAAPNTDVVVDADGRLVDGPEDDDGDVSVVDRPREVSVLPVFGVMPPAEAGDTEILPMSVEWSTRMLVVGVFNCRVLVCCFGCLAVDGCKDVELKMQDVSR